MSGNYRNRDGAKALSRSTAFATVWKTTFSFGPGDSASLANYFECRAGPAIRLVFRAEKGCLIFFAAGDHAAIRKLLKAL
jgi:hypothetical protein